MLRFINNPDSSCFICGKFVPMKRRQNIAAFVKMKPGLLIKLAEHASNSLDNGSIVREILYLLEYPLCGENL
jgi:hypothetical protein